MSGVQDDLVATTQEVCDLPLTSTQRGLLALLELEPTTTAYHMPVVVALDGTLDIAQLQSVLDDVVARHEVLRTVVAGPEGDPVQRIRRRGTVALEPIEVCPGQNPIDGVSEFLLRPFDLRTAAPVRIGWAASDTGILVGLCASHVFLDGTSLQVLLEEVDAAYLGLRGADQSGLDFGDVVLWREDQGASADDLRYWREALADVAAHWPPAVTSRRAAPAVTVEAARVVVPVDSEVVAHLTATARESGTTLMSTCAAAWSMVLARWAGERSVTMLTPLSGRPLPEVERVVGNLTSVLPISWKVAPGETLASVGVRALRACGEAMTHQSAGLPELVSDLNPSRTPGRESWSDVLFAFNEIPSLTTWCGVPARRLDVPLRRAKSDLCLDIRHEGSTITLCLDHRNDLIAGAEAEQLLSALVTALSNGALPATAFAPAGAEVTDAENNDAPAAPEGLPLGDSGQHELLGQLAGWAHELVPEIQGSLAPHDDLFEAGADSLRLLRLVALARRAGWHVDTRQVFQEPTLLGIARGARRSDAGAQGDSVAVPPPTTRPATATERRMWLLQEMQDVPVDAYVVPAVMRVHGRLDVEALRDAFRLVGERHPALRTTVAPAADGGLEATTQPDPELELELLTEGDDPGVIAREQIARGFDLARLPLARASVVEAVPDEWLVVVTVHHVAVDDQSSATLVEDLWHVYEDLHGERVPTPLPETMATEDDPLDVPALTNFWASQLTDVEPAAPLVPDLDVEAPSRPAAGHSLIGNEVRFRVDHQTADSIRQHAARRKATPFMVLTAAVGLVQSAHAAEQATCVAVPWSASAGVAGPSHGNRTNTLAVPVRTARYPDPIALLDDVRGAVLEGLSHGALPFEHVLEAWRLGDRSGPLFRVMATWQETVPSGLSVAGLHVYVEHQEVGTQKFDLTVVARVDSDGAWSCTVRFDPVAVGASLAARWARDLEVTLTSFASGNPDRRPLDVVAPEERRVLRGAQHRARGPWPLHLGLHELADRTLRGSPDRVALRVLGTAGTPDEVVSARDLDRRSRVVQTRLRDAGVRPGDRVGLVLPRGADLVSAELAVMRAGAAVVPLPVTSPVRRTEAMARLAACTVLCAAERPSWWTGPVVVPGDDDADPGPLPAIRTSPDDIAYIMFTSGSTGVPKGVPVDHGSIVNNLCWMQDEWPLAADDRLLWKTVETFDVSIKEIFWPLLAGAELLVSRPGDEMDASRITEIVQQYRVTVVHLVPSLLDITLQAADRLGRDLSSLRVVMCGAETVRPDAVQRLHAVCGARLLHLYGPTEAAIAVTGWSGELSEAGARIPLGRPVPGSRVVVRGPDLGEAPRCTVGELWIGGDPLGRGYLGSAADTAARFLPDPQGPPGSRMYRTGDLARVREDLLLEFRGRTDDQVKIRGIRVELGEVEATLRGLPGVTAAAAKWWPPRLLPASTIPASLVAYVVGDGLDETVVIDQLRDRLPTAMVPARVLVVPALPFGRTHKVDRNRLPYPEPETTEPADREPPRYEALALLWAELLGVTEVHRRQEFSVTGGHSLTAAELSMRITAELNRDVSVGDVLGHPVYGDLEDLVLSREVVTEEPIPLLDRSAFRAAETTPPPT